MNFLILKIIIQIPEKTLALLKKTLAQFPEIEEAIIFGSRSMNTAKKGSDIDIAIKGKLVTTNTVIKLHGYLEEELSTPYFFDVVDYQTLSNENLKKHIDEEGENFYKQIF